MAVYFSLLHVLYLLLLLVCNGTECNSKKESFKQIQDENEIFKSKIDFLSELFRAQLDLLKSKSNYEVEMIFLIDASSSIGDDNFKSELRFIRKLIADFPVSPEETRVAIITFATEVVINVNHLGPMEVFEKDKCSLLNYYLPNIEYIGGNTNTRKALEVAYEIMQSSTRNKAQKVIFLVTDGFSNNGPPEPIAEDLKKSGCTIFTFGIKSGNVEELRNIASLPWKNHGFLLESFVEFEIVAHKALHKDLSHGKYSPVSNQTLCHKLCHDSESCCGENATCACGKHSGRFTCLCPPGYYGLGIRDRPCKPCPEGTYHDGSIHGDEKNCRPCPDQNQKTKSFPATNINDCVCNEGFTPVDNKCEVIRCPTLEAPNNGYFVNKKCSNILHAGCGVKCNVGYDLKGSSVRICQKNATWSGETADCVLKNCEYFQPVPNAEVTCKHEEYPFDILMRYGDRGQKIQHVIKRKTRKNYNETNELFNHLKYLPVDTQCRFTCPTGFSQLGSKVRVCLPITRWDGLKASCKPIKCSSIHKIPHGQVNPDNCTIPGLRHKFGSKCEITCDQGFKLKTMNSTRFCTGRHGAWTGKNIPYKCLDVSAPVIKCPENVTLSTDKGQSFVTINMTLPNATDNSGVQPVIWSHPPLGKNISGRFEIGNHVIVVYAVDPSGNLASCNFSIVIEDKEPPKIEMCNKSKTLAIEELFNTDWEEPVISDNAGNYTVNVTYKFEESKTAAVTYKVTDAAGNEANCTLSFTLAEEICNIRPLLKNAIVTCEQINDTVVCNVRCKSGFISQNDNATVTCFNHTWTSDWFDGSWSQYPDCLAIDETLVHQKVIYEVPSVFGNAICLYSNKSLPGELNFFNSTVRLALNCENGNLTKQKRDIGAYAKKKSFLTFSVEGTFAATSFSYGQNIVGGKEIDHKELLEAINNLLKNISVVNEPLEMFNVSFTKAVLSCRGGSIPVKNYCVKCGAGSYHRFTENSCQPCEAGKFQHLEGQTSCLECPPGTLTPQLKSKSIKDCKNICSRGKFGKRKYVSLSVEPCVHCPVNYYQDRLGSMECIKCPKNTKTIQKGSTSMLDCIPKAKDPCENFTCLHEGKCVVISTYPTCLCKNGFLGTFCEFLFDPCLSSPCLNGASCQSHSNSSEYKCFCVPGYVGTHCEDEYSSCLSNPCLNNGTCSDIFNDFECQCPQNFYGKNCNMSICHLFNPCLNNGICLLTSSAIINCQCLENFSGKFCEYKLENLTVPDNRYTIQDLCEKHCSHGDYDCVSSDFYYYCKFRVSTESEVRNLDYKEDSIAVFDKNAHLAYMSFELSDVFLSEFSATFWIYTGDTFNFGTVFSFASNTNDNAFTLTDYGGLVLYIHGERVITNVAVNDKKWHFVCITWESENGSWQLFVDAILEASGRNLARGKSFVTSGKMILGQEQDFIGGGFSQVEAFVGNLTLVEFWAKVLNTDEITKAYTACGPFYIEKKLISWIEFLKRINGKLEVMTSRFCKGCIALNETLYNGIIRRVDNSYYGYYCNPGYKIKFRDDILNMRDQNYWLRECGKTGEWKGTSPFCVRLNCGFPGYFPSGKIHGSSYLFNDSLSYSCNDGLSLIGNSSIRCTETGEWSSSIPKCRKETRQFCEDLTAPRFGSMFILNSTLHFAPGVSVQFQCNSGFSLNGTGMLTCQKDRVWDFFPPSCHPTNQCYPPKVSSDVLVTQKGNVAELYCYSTLMYQTVVCEKGVWNISKTFCSALCTTPSPPTNSYIVLDDLGMIRTIYDEGEQVYFTCSLTLKLPVKNFATCLKNGLWAFSGEPCKYLSNE